MRLEVAQRYDNYLYISVMPSLIFAGDYIFRRWCLYKNIPCLTNKEIVLLNSICSLGAVAIRKSWVYRPESSQNSLYGRVGSTLMYCGVVWYVNLITIYILFNKKYINQIFPEKTTGYSFNPMLDFFRRKTCFHKMFITFLVDQISVQIMYTAEKEVRQAENEELQKLRRTWKNVRWEIVLQSHDQSIMQETFDNLPLRYRQFKQAILRKDTYFQVMGLEEGSSEDQIKRKFRELLLVVHPDKIPQQYVQNQRVVQEFNALFDILNHANNLCKNIIIF